MGRKKSIKEEPKDDDRIETVEQFEEIYGIKYDIAKQVLRYCFGSSAANPTACNHELAKIKVSEFRRAVTRLPEAKKNAHLKDIYDPHCV